MAAPAPGPGLLRLLPAPSRGYPSLRDDLVRLGWEWANESQELPMLPGEPEWVVYTHPSGAALEYEFLPPVALRTVVAKGPPDVLVPLLDLPRLDVRDVGVMLDAAAYEDVLRGLFAVRALRWLPLIGRVRRLAAEHPDRVVRDLAADVAAGLPQDAAEDTIGRLRAWREAHPGRSGLLAMMPVQDRRQVLRWLGTRRGEPSPGTLEALRTGLEDEDPEVRVTAALVAARLRAVELASLAGAADVPEVLREPQDRARRSLRAGAPIGRLHPEEQGDVLVRALLDPLPPVPRPGRLPFYLVEDVGVRLRVTGLPMALVPAAPHWLAGGMTLVPPRQTTMAPFALTAAPVDLGTARLLGLAGASGSDVAPFLATAAQAEDMLLRVGDIEGVRPELVTAERWEAALRGPDGRRYTAGNVAADVAISPWGALAVPGVRERLAGGLAADPADLSGVAHAGPDEPLPVRVAVPFVT